MHWVGFILPWWWLRFLMNACHSWWCLLFLVLVCPSWWRSAIFHSGLRFLILDPSFYPHDDGLPSWWLHLHTLRWSPMPAKMSPSVRCLHCADDKPLSGAFVAVREVDLNLVLQFGRKWVLDKQRFKLTPLERFNRLSFDSDLTSSQGVVTLVTLVTVLKELLRWHQIMGCHKVSTFVMLLGWLTSYYHKEQKSPRVRQ